MADLGQAIGSTFNLPQNIYQQETSQVAGGGDPEELPEVDADKQASKAFPGTAESESYIESIQSLEGWLAEQYSKGIYPDKVGDGSPESLAIGQLYRQKKADIKRQASHLSNMINQENLYRKRLAEGDIYQRGESAVDPLSGRKFIPTQEDYNRVVSKDLAPVVRSFQSKSPTGSLYDSRAILGAKDNFARTEQETNDYYDDLAKKFGGDEVYVQNIERAREQSLDVLNTLRPIQKRTPREGGGEGDKKKKLDFRRRELDEAKQGVLEAIRKLGSNTKISGKSVSKTEFIEKGTERGQENDIIRFYTSVKKPGGGFRDEVIRDVNADDDVTINDVYSSRYDKFSYNELPTLREFDPVPERERAFTVEENDDLGKMQIGDVSSLEKLKHDQIVSIKYNDPWIGSKEIVIEWKDGETETLNMVGRATKSRLREIYGQAKMSSPKKEAGILNVAGIATKSGPKDKPSSGRKQIKGF